MAPVAQMGRYMASVAQMVSSSSIASSSLVNDGDSALKMLKIEISYCCQNK